MPPFVACFQDLRYLLFDMGPMLHIHILIVITQGKVIANVSLFCFVVLIPHDVN